MPEETATEDCAFVDEEKNTGNIEMQKKNSFISSG